MGSSVFQCGRLLAQEAHLVQASLGLFWGLSGPAESLLRASIRGTIEEGEGLFLGRWLVLLLARGGTQRGVWLCGLDALPLVARGVWWPAASLCRAVLETDGRS